MTKKKNQKKKQEKPAQEDFSEATLVRRQQELLDECARRLHARSSASTQEGGSASSSGGSASSSSSGPRNAAGVERFPVRRIKFQGRVVPTLMQSRFGPCALLAVANGLLLQGLLDLKLGPKEDDEFVTSTDLIERLTTLCKELNNTGADEDANAHEVQQDLLRSLPRLLDGLMLNCRFASCDSFENVAELSLFDLFRLKLFHVWVAPSEILDIVSSYNALVEFLAVAREVHDTISREGREPTEEEEAVLAKSMLLEEWYHQNQSQATAQGFLELLDQVRESDVCVLFRNNHFCTVHKPKDGLLCSLLTDSAFQGEPGAVWESLETEGGSGQILGAEFTPCGEALEARAPSDSALTEEQQDMVSMIVAVGFSEDFAIEGLKATNFRSAEEAVQAILEAQENGETDVITALRTRPERGSDENDESLPENYPDVRDIMQIVRKSEIMESLTHVCPTCQKKFGTAAAMKSHWLAKNH